MGLDSLFLERSEILKTTDGGQSWASVATGMGRAWLTGVALLSQDSLVVVGYTTSGAYNPGIIRISTNGGQTWISKDKTPATDPNYPGTYGGLNAVTLSNDGTYWAAGESGRVLVCSDKGMTWRYLPTPLGFNNQFLRTVSSFNGKNVLVGGSNGFLGGTSDAGSSWSMLNRDITDYSQLYDVVFHDSLNGVVVGDHASYVTNNGGNSWTTYPFVERITLSRLSFVSSTNGWADGWFLLTARLHKTTDGGKSWFDMSNGIDCPLQTSVFFLDDLTGWVCGCDEGTPTIVGRISHTTDGGLTWTTDRLPASVAAFVFDIHFVGKTEGWAVGGRYSDTTNSQGAVETVILLTSDGGNSWSPQTISSFGFLRSVRFANNQVGFAAGDNGILLKTTDGGNHWNLLVLPAFSGHLERVYAINDQVLYVCGTDGSIYSSFNGGTTWNRNTSPSSAWLYGLSFVNETKGWAVGGSSILTSTYQNSTSINTAKSLIPVLFYLSQNYPNPFNPTTMIRYGLPEREDTRLIVYNTLGQKVMTLVQETQEAGLHEAKFDGSNLASGVYFYRIQAGSFVQTKRLLLLK
jgi:photosystem II stability/assembly factor-like uncharacterized protein